MIQTMSIQILQIFGKYNECQMCIQALEQQALHKFALLFRHQPRLNKRSNTASNSIRSRYSLRL